MTTTAVAADKLESALQDATGIDNVVETLLRVCSAERLNCDWMDNVCRVEQVSGGAPAYFEAPLSKSQFRAVLARFAVLCGLQDTSPYRGTAILKVEPLDVSRCFSIGFENTPDEQWLCIRLAQANEVGKTSEPVDNGIPPQKSTQRSDRQLAVRSITQ